MLVHEDIDLIYKRACEILSETDATPATRRCSL